MPVIFLHFQRFEATFNAIAMSLSISIGDYRYDATMRIRLFYRIIYVDDYLLARSV